MSEIKIDQVNAVLKGLGFEDADITAITTGGAPDAQPFIDKIRAENRKLILTDKDFIEEIQKPFKDAGIGKENQLKKDVRKFYGLSILEDDLKKMSFEELLKKGVESRGASTEGALQKAQKEAGEWQEKFENLEASIPTKLKEEGDKWQNKMLERDTREEYMSLVAGDNEIPIQKENVTGFTTAYFGWLRENGLTPYIDDKRACHLKDKEGNVAKNENGNILRPKESMKNFYSIFTGNVHPAGGKKVEGGGGGGASAPVGDEALIEMLGTGLGTPN